VPQFWNRWLQNRARDGGDTDRFLLSFIQLHTACSTRDGYTPDVFEEAWNLFRPSSRRWKLPHPPCRIVPAPPRSLAALKAWARTHNATPMLDYLAAELEEDGEHDAPSARGRSA
jgi:hypothetical protein